MVTVLVEVDIKRWVNMPHGGAITFYQPDNEFLIFFLNTSVYRKQ